MPEIFRRRAAIDENVYFFQPVLREFPQPWKLDVTPHHVWDIQHTRTFIGSKFELLFSRKQ
jgi:hypothetical protein